MDSQTDGPKDCQNLSSERAGEDGAWAIRSPPEAGHSVAVLPGVPGRET